MTNFLLQIFFFNYDIVVMIYFFFSITNFSFQSQIVLRLISFFSYETQQGRLNKYNILCHKHQVVNFVIHQKWNENHGFEFIICLQFWFGQTKQTHEGRVGTLKNYINGNSSTNGKEIFFCFLYLLFLRKKFSCGFGAEERRYSFEY